MPVPPRTISDADRILEDCDLSIRCNPAGDRLYHGTLRLPDGSCFEADGSSLSALVDWACEIRRYHE